MKKISIKKSLRFAIIIISSFVGMFFVGYTLYFLNFSAQTNALSRSDNLIQDLNIWARKVEFLRIFPETTNISYKNILIMNTLDSYINNLSKFNDYNLVKLPKIEFTEYTEKDTAEQKIQYQEDNQFFKGWKYLYNTENVTHVVSAVFRLKINGIETDNAEVELTRKTLEEFNTEVTGTLENNKVIDIIKSSFNNLLDTIKKDNLDNVLQELSPINDLKAKSGSIIPDSFDLQIKDTDNSLAVGKLNLKQTNSKYFNSVDVVYDKALKTYTFTNLFNLFSQISLPVVVIQTTPTPTGDTVINCTDCFLAPVDKYHSLPSTYYPSVINTSLSGGGQLTSNTVSALRNLFDDAKSKRIDITIISSFRSYQTQVTTFNYWVTQQKNKGLFQAEAEIQANRISARPGHSEHQLGTTADLKCTSCGNFDSSEKNLTLYQYLEQNAYKYGFVISYPKNKETLTGYSYEPWHIRFIGVELATEFFNKNYITTPGLSSTILLSQLL